MIPIASRRWIAALMLAGLAGSAVAQDAFTLSSPVMFDGGTFPADLKCTRDGGDGLTPPLAWSGAPAEPRVWR